MGGNGEREVERLAEAGFGTFEDADAGIAACGVDRGVAGGLIGAVEDDEDFEVGMGLGADAGESVLKAVDRPDGGSTGTGVKLGGEAVDGESDRDGRHVVEIG